jgi:hypothetical protein
MKLPSVPLFPKCSPSVPQGTGVTTVPLFPTPYIWEQGTGNTYRDHFRPQVFPNSGASTTARGYGNQHQKLRKQWAARVAAGTVTCWRCHRLIAPWAEWELGHDDWDRDITRGPEHKACNRKAAAAKAKLIRTQTVGKPAKRARLNVMDTSRDW